MTRFCDAPVLTPAHNSAVSQDWKTMCDMLMARKSSGMSDDEETALVRLLCASMRRGVGKSRYCSPEHIKVIFIRSSVEDLTVVLMVALFLPILPPVTAVQPGEGNALAIDGQRD